MFSETVKKETPLKGLHILSLKTGVKDVVTIAGSLLGGSEFSPPGNLVTASLTTSMLDKGTDSQDKFAISEKLEKVGASLAFSSDKYHVNFTGHCLQEDVSLLIELLAEQLQEPAFLEEELETLKIRTVGNLERAKENTKEQAAIVFLRKLYPDGHPNRRLTTEEAIDSVQTLSVRDLKTFHKTGYGLGNLLFTVVGDVDHDTILGKLKEQFSSWKSSSLSLGPSGKQAQQREASEGFVHIPDKTSADMYLGQAIGIDQDHEDYYALMTGVYILGGNFSARLMQTVRDQQGLTYGIGSSVAGVSFGNDGYWSVWATFGPDLLQTGREATAEQIKLWHTQGVNGNELEAKKNTITGSYKVGMDTTGGLAAQILSNAERGRPIDYLDRFPDIIRKLTLTEVNQAIKKYVDPSRLTFVAAGTLNQEN